MSSVRVLKVLSGKLCFRDRGSGVTANPDEQRTRIVDILTNAFWDRASTFDGWCGLSVSFHPDTLIVNVLGGDLSLIRPCMEASVRIVEESGQIHVAGQTSAKIDAVALWYPPGHDFVPTCVLYNPSQGSLTATKREERLVRRGC